MLKIEGYSDDTIEIAGNYSRKSQVPNKCKSGFSIDCFSRAIEGRPFLFSTIKAEKDSKYGFYLVALYNGTWAFFPSMKVGQDEKSEMLPKWSFKTRLPERENLKWLETPYSMILEIDCPDDVFIESEVEFLND